MSATAQTARVQGIEFLVVDKHVAMNPVARSIARARITQATKTFTTRVWMLEDGEVVDADLQAAAKVLAVALRILDQRNQNECPAHRVMRGGMSALVALAQRKSVWRRADAPAIDIALQHAVDVYTQASAMETNKAHQWVEALDRDVRAAA